MRVRAWIAVAAATAVVCLTAGTAAAHDSWLSPSGATSPVPAALELATGTRFPLQQFGPAAVSVVQAQCDDGSGHRLPLRPVHEHPQRLALEAAADGRATRSPLSCWAELREAEIELEPRVVQVYFAEIHASAALRAAWTALRERGLPWRERYRKFARIELGADRDLPAGSLAAVRRPAGLDLEIVVLGDGPVAVGELLEVRVLRDGQPLAGFPVELVSERNAVGVWRETDAGGAVRHRLPFAGRWLLRGTDLRLAEGQEGAWESRFVTLAVEAR